uniref:Uncharacterized protein LOC108047575 n=1 Tax=Drosophila rhopaloa TaxID=1041015 RepID=A0A6P4EYU9_DRORH
MKGITLIVLCSILVLSLLINVTFGYSMKVSLNFPERAGFPSKTTLRCDSGNYIVVRKGILFYNNGKKNEKAWYPPKMACDFEETCTFELVEEQYKYLELKEGGNLELQIQYDCKPKNFKGNPRRISQYGQIGKCPHDSFVQKHVGYIWNDDIVSNSETAKKERESDCHERLCSSQTF